MRSDTLLTLRSYRRSDIFVTYTQQCGNAHRETKYLKSAVGCFLNTHPIKRIKGKVRLFYASVDDLKKRSGAECRREASNTSWFGRVPQLATAAARYRVTCRRSQLLSAAPRDVTPLQPKCICNWCDAQFFLQSHFL